MELEGEKVIDKVVPLHLAPPDGKGFVRSVGEATNTLEAKIGRRGRTEAESFMPAVPSGMALSLIKQHLWEKSSHDLEFVHKKMKWVSEIQ